MDLFTNGSHWLQENQGMIIAYIVNIAAALMILVFGIVVAKILGKATEKLLTARKLDHTISYFVATLVRYAVLAFVLIAALSRVGVQTASFVAVIGAAGLAVGLALQGSLSNFAAGVLIITFRPFKAGDFVEIAGTSGSIKSVHIFTTELSTPDNKLVVVPNGAILSNNIVNYSAHATRRIDLVVGISYDSDLNLAKQVLHKVCESDSRVLNSPETVVGVSELADSSVNLVVRPWVKSEDYWAAYFDLNENIKIELDKAGISIPFPQLDVHLNKALS